MNNLKIDHCKFIDNATDQVALYAKTNLPILIKKKADWLEAANCKLRIEN